MNEQCLRYPAPQERQDLQDKLAFAGHFLRYDEHRKLELWTWPVRTDDPVSTRETYDSVEEAYAKVFRNVRPKGVTE